MGLTLMTAKVRRNTIADMKQIGQLIEVTNCINISLTILYLPNATLIWNEIQRLLSAKPNFYS